jgi:hypothetical protein
MGTGGYLVDEYGRIKDGTYGLLSNQRDLVIAQSTEE